MPRSNTLSFSTLNLHESVQRALAAAGYTEPTPVQAAAIPAALEGQDLIVSAQTGTGKTAAFMLPALSAIADDPRKAGRGPRVLVLTPTRELAQQVTAAAVKRLVAPGSGGDACAGIVPSAVATAAPTATAHIRVPDRRVIDAPSVSHHRCYTSWREP